MDQWIVFLQDRWYLILIALVVIIVVVNVVKTVIKWVLVIALLAVVSLYGWNYIKDEGNLNELKTMGSNVLESVKEQAMKAVVGEAKEAKYHQNTDGSYTVTSKNVQIDGTPGSNEVKVTFMKQTFTVKIDETIQKYMDDAKKNS